jgi:hypothetical protein
MLQTAVCPATTDKGIQVTLDIRATCDTFIGALDPLIATPSPEPVAPVPSLTTTGITIDSEDSRTVALTEAITPAGIGIALGPESTHLYVPGTELWQLIVFPA